MELVIVALIVIFLVLGIIGSFIPVIPGPPFAFIAFLLHHFFISQFSLNLMLLVALIACVVTFLDYYLQIYYVDKKGGGKVTILFTIIGMIIGLFIIPVLGIILGSFLGSFIGAKIESIKNPVNIAFGAVIGFMFGSVLKFVLSMYILLLIFIK